MAFVVNVSTRVSYYDLDSQVVGSGMSRIVLEHLDEATLARLSEPAKLNRLSVEGQAEKLLAEAVDMRARRRRRGESADRIAAMTPKVVTQTDSVILLREDRDR